MAPTKTYRDFLKEVPPGILTRSPGSPTYFQLVSVPYGQIKLPTWSCFFPNQYYEDPRKTGLVRAELDGEQGKWEPGKFQREPKRPGK